MLSNTGTNDGGIGMKAALFVQTMRTFVTHLAEIYHETLTHICIIVRPFHRCFLILKNFPFSLSLLAFSALFPVRGRASAIHYHRRVRPDSRAGRRGAHEYRHTRVGLGESARQAIDD